MTDGAEAWATTKREEELAQWRERKIFGIVKEVGIWGVGKTMSSNEHGYCLK